MSGGASEMSLRDCPTPHETLHILEEAVERLGLDPEKAEFAQERYAALYNDVQRLAAATELHNVEEKTLRRELETEQLLSAGDENKSEDAVNDLLQGKLKEAHVAAAVAVQKEATLEEEVQEMTETRHEAACRYEEEREAHRRELRPVLEQLQAEVELYTDVVAAEHEKQTKAQKELSNLQSALETCNAQISDWEKVKSDELAQLNRVKSEPAKQKRQNEDIENVLRGLQSRNAEQGAALNDVESELVQLMERQREAELEHAQSLSTAEQGRLATEARRGDLGVIQRDVEGSLLEHRQQLADRVQVDFLAEEKDRELKRATEAKRKADKEKEHALRDLTEFQKSLDAFTGLLAPLENATARLKREKAELEKRLTTVQAARETLQQEEDVFMSDYLKVEAEEGSIEACVAQALEFQSRLEEEIQSHRSVESANSKMLQSLLKERDHALRSLSVTKKQHQETGSSLILKNKEVEDLESLYAEKSQSRAQFQELYDLMKNERNRFVHHIQVEPTETATWSLMGRKAVHEIESKLKVLEQELDCQRDVHQGKCSELETLQREHQEAVEERDGLRAEISQLRLQWTDNLTLVDQESCQIEKSLFTLDQCERDMAAAKAGFEQLLQNRNFTGLLLIDRNDEICLLYEKFNLHEHIQKQGALELRKRGDELRLLKLRVAEVRRSIAASHKAQEQIPEMDNEVAWLKCQLLEARKAVEMRSVDMENPDNPARWRRLEGTDAEPEQLQAQIRQLQLSLDHKQGQVTQRELIRQEISSLVDRIQSQLQHGSQSRTKLGRDLVKYELKDADLTLKLKAASAELSILKDMALEAVQEREALREVVREAKTRFAAGMAPTEAIEKEWEQILRQDAALERLAAEKHQRESLSVDEVPSRCPLRPNAYIPDDLGIPRPFGAGAFKPTPAGANMRHIKAPKLPEVLL